MLLLVLPGDAVTRQLFSADDRFKLLSGTGVSDIKVCGRLVVFGAAAAAVAMLVREADKWSLGDKEQLLLSGAAAEVSSDETYTYKSPSFD